MHNKILGAALCLVLIVMTIVATIYCNDNQYYHQYLNEDTITNSSVNANDRNWNCIYIKEDDYLLNQYFFMNLAGDLIKNSPLVRYDVIDNQLVLIYQKPEKCLEPYAKYEISIKPVDEQNDFLTEDSQNGIVSFVDYNYLSTKKRCCTIPYSNGYSTSQIRNEMSYFEKCIYSSDYASSEYGYKTLVDEYNFANYFLLYELAYSGYCSEENFTLYKDKNNKYSLCHNSFENSGIQKEDDYHNLLASTWFTMITKSDEFSSNIINEYKYLRLTSFSEKSLEKELDKCVSFLLSYKLINEDELMKQKNELSSYIFNRINWLDNNIESIKEFSALSAIKEYITTPY